MAAAVDLHLQNCCMHFINVVYFCAFNVVQNKQRSII